MKILMKPLENPMALWAACAAAAMQSLKTSMLFWQWRAHELAQAGKPSAGTKHHETGVVHKKHALYHGKDPESHPFSGRSGT